MNKDEVFDNCKARIKNQLRIHWVWLRKEEDYEKVFKSIEAWMNKAIKRQTSEVKEKNDKKM